MSKSSIVNFRVTDYKSVKNNEIIDALTNVGPLAVILKPPPMNYKGGILTDLDDDYCANNFNQTSVHAALLVGYDSVNDTFLVKNSWGKSW